MLNYYLKKIEKDDQNNISIDSEEYNFNMEKIYSLYIFIFRKNKKN